MYTPVLHVHHLGYVNVAADVKQYRFI